MCSNCWQKTADFHQFHCDVQRAQEKFLEGCVKHEIEENDALDEHQNQQLTFCNVQETEPIHEIVTEMVPEVGTNRTEGIDLELKTENKNDFAGEFDAIDFSEEIFNGFEDQIEDNSMIQMEGMKKSTENMFSINATYIFQLILLYL